MWYISKRGNGILAAEEPRCWCHTCTQSERIFSVHLFNMVTAVAMLELKTASTREKMYYDKPHHLKSRTKGTSGRHELLYMYICICRSKCECVWYNQWTPLYAKFSYCDSVAISLLVKLLSCASCCILSSTPDRLRTILAWLDPISCENWYDGLTNWHIAFHKHTIHKELDAERATFYL